MYLRLVGLTRTSDPESIKILSEGMVESITDLQRHITHESASEKYIREAMEWTFENLSQRGACVLLECVFWTRKYVNVCDRMRKYV